MKYSNHLDLGRPPTAVSGPSTSSVVPDDPSADSSGRRGRGFKSRHPDAVVPGEAPTQLSRCLTCFICACAYVIARAVGRHRHGLSSRPKAVSGRQCTHATTPCRKASTTCSREAGRHRPDFAAAQQSPTWTPSTLLRLSPCWINHSGGAGRLSSPRRRSASRRSSSAIHPSSWRTAAVACCTTTRRAKRSSSSREGWSLMRSILRFRAGYGPSTQWRTAAPSLALPRGHRCPSGSPFSASRTRRMSSSGLKERSTSSTTPNEHYGPRHWR